MADINDSGQRTAAARFGLTRPRPPRAARVDRRSDRTPEAVLIRRDHFEAMRAVREWPRTSGFGVRLLSESLPGTRSTRASSGRAGRFSG